MVAMLGLACFAGACGAFAAPAGKTASDAVEQQNGATGPVPTGRLPASVKPLAYTLELMIRPGGERFSGRTQIAVELAQPADRIWLHGQGLHVASASATVGGERIDASYREVDDHGVSLLRFARTLPAGQALLELSYDAPFDTKLAGLYKVETDGAAYAFTQFEPHAARKAFPCFDEPAFKTSFDVWLTVEEGHQAIANTPMLTTEKAAGGLQRIHFATTKPLPTYLVAFAVGPLDVVDGPAVPPSAVRTDPLPLRGVAVRGKGQELAYALDNTGRLVLELERYFGIAYPYEKLDIIAVPDFGAGAMENAGAITFREWLLLIDGANAPEGQRRSFAQVMAHELAHHWFGDLVTMPWWDDIWLNEAFATWMGHRVVAAVHPDYRSELDLLSGVHHAMEADSRQSARRIRQPIESTHDISNAFDPITYEKGAAVLGMFERYLGPEVFRSGIQAHLRAHAHGVADSDALLQSLSQAADKDVATPFKTFLDQVGTPLVNVEMRCAGQPTLYLSQSRYLPVGSSALADQVWQVPVCASFGIVRKTRERCHLLTEAEGALALDVNSCPRWVMPNAGAAGYYRFSLAGKDLEQLRRNGFGRLRDTEKVALADSLEAGFSSATLQLPQVFAMFPTLVADSSRSVATSPMGLLWFTRERLLSADDIPAFEAYARKLYAPLLERLTWEARPTESGDAKLLRADVIEFLALAARDPEVRELSSELGREILGYGEGGQLDMDAAPAELRNLVVRVALEDGDAALFDHAYALFVKQGDPMVRWMLLRALAAVRDPERSTRALALALDPAVRVNEINSVLNGQLADERTRAAAWRWIEQHFDAIVARLPGSGGGSMPWLAAHFCDEAMVQRTQAFFGPRIDKLTGGPRSLDGALEAMRLCVAQVAAHREAAAAFF